MLQTGHQAQTDTGHGMYDFAVFVLLYGMYACRVVLLRLCVCEAGCGGAASVGAELSMAEARTHGIRATSGFCITHMPLSTSSTFKTVKEILTSACRLANEATADPDMDLQGLLEALWTNQYLRRMSDTAARRYMNDASFGRDRVEPWEIDLLFGWNEAEMSKDMQMHSAKMSLRERIKQAIITCMI